MGLGSCDMRLTSWLKLHLLPLDIFRLNFMKDNDKLSSKHTTA